MYKIFALGVLAIAFLVALFIDGFVPSAASPAENPAKQQSVNAGPEQQMAGNDVAVVESYTATPHEAEEFDDNFGEPTDSGLPMFDTKGAAEDEDFGDVVVSGAQDDIQPSRTVETRAVTANPAPRIVKALPEQGTATAPVRPGSKYVPKPERETAVKPTENIRY